MGDLIKGGGGPEAPGGGGGGGGGRKGGHRRRLTRYLGIRQRAPRTTIQRRRNQEFAFDTVLIMSYFAFIVT